MAHVLIVEDVPEMLDLMSQLIKPIPGVTKVSGASNVAEARHILGRDRPDFVFLDEILPGESSMDLLQLLLEDGIPVCLLTGMEEPTHEVSEGALGRLKKPHWKELEARRSDFEVLLKGVLG